MSGWLNLHERRLLRSVGLTGGQRATMRQALAADGQIGGGEVDVAAQMGGFQLAKIGVRNDLAQWFDHLLVPYGRPVGKVVYGHRRYRKWVILAAALQQAGVSPATYSRGRSQGLRCLAEFDRS